MGNVEVLIGRIPKAVIIVGTSNFANLTSSFTE